MFMKSVHKVVDKHEFFAQVDTFSTRVDLSLPVHVHLHLSIVFARICAVSKICFAFQLNIPLGMWLGCMVGHTKCLTLTPETVVGIPH